MTPERYAQIKQMLDRAFSLTAEERQALFNQLDLDDPALRREVESLLARDAVATDYFTKPGRALATANFADVLASISLPYENIGSYKLVRELGHGGMGTVFLAERADGQFQQRVAIKLLRFGGNAGGAVQRFKHERQILAALDHPNIAKLLDGGTTQDGQPYLVLEFIEGVPIDIYCQRNQLPLNDRLRLFRQICAAVHYAHQHLVIHRDIKPSNILVTNEGVPKLLDFGIAKLLAPEQFDLTAFETAIHGAPMTPAYASPEQVRGQPISTATDVYSLGIVLYELLTGRRPYEIKAEFTPWEMARVICEAEPARPSTAAECVPVTRVEKPALETNSSASSAQPASTQSPEKWQRQLQGDLDNIVLMALRKEPQSRYASVEQLSEDLRRYLEGLPVNARPHTFGYRFSKFIQRHKLPVAAAAALALVICIAAIGQWRQKRQTELERDRADRVANLMVDLFEAADPETAQGKSITVVEALAKGEAKMREDLKDQPLVRATILRKIGEVYCHLAQYDRAQKPLEDALEIRRSLLGANHAEVADSLHELGFLYWNKSEYEKAEPLYREAINVFRRTLGNRNEETANAINSLGVLLRDRGSLDEAEKLMREALALRRQINGAESEEAANTLNNLATLWQDRANYAEAEAAYHESLAIRRKKLGNEHSIVAHGLRNLAVLLGAKGDFNTAEQYFNEALNITLKVMGPNHPDVALLLTDVGSTRRRKGNYDTAEQPLRDALALRRKILGNQHPQIADSLNELAVLLYDKTDYAAAEPLYREALEIRRKVFGTEHELVALVTANLAVALQAKSDYNAAEPLYRSALQIRRKLLGNEHPAVAITLANLGVLLHLKKEYAQAEPLFREALAIQTKALPPKHPDVISTKIGLGRMLTDKGDALQAESLLREGLQVRQENFPKGHVLIADAQSALGGCLTVLKKFEEAEPLLLNGYEVLQAKRSDKHRSTQRALERLIMLYQSWEKPDKAAAFQSLQRKNKS
jgi:eukaryotic-like serine/threonine-protein kinase